MKRLTVRLTWSPTDAARVGELAQVGQRIYFEFDGDFLRRGIQVSPFKWPLRGGLIEHVDRGFGVLPGWIDDSLPDGWGLLLMDRMFRRRGIDPIVVSPLDRLAYLGTRTMGALTYHPPDDVDGDNEAIDLKELGTNAQRVYSGEAAEVLPALMRAGGSPGGSRPKVLVGIKGKEVVSGEGDLREGFEAWIVKFCAKESVRDAGPMEYAYSNMARKAGIDMPQTRLFKVAKSTSYFGVRRFDRVEGNRRIHVHTFGNMIHANFRIPSTDYADLMKVTGALTKNHEDMRRVFRRMAFNVAAHNRDDHAKNFAFLMDESGEWRVSPAYDLGFADGPGGEHSMTIVGEGRVPGREQMLEVAKFAGIEKKDAVAIIDEVNEAVGQWPRFAEEAGCTTKTRRMVGNKMRPI